MPNCIFCDIAAKATGAQIVYEDDSVVAFRDLRPAAPGHALVIPKKHLEGIRDATAADEALLGRILLAAIRVAELLGLSERGYRLVMNQGPDAGQSVFHLHCHVIGGRRLAWPPG